MKRLCILIITACFLVGATVAMAGEKEDLTLKLQLIIETEKRMQAEFKLLQIEKGNLTAQFRALQAKEKAKKPDKPEKEEKR